MSYFSRSQLATLLRQSCFFPVGVAIAALGPPGSSGPIFTQYSFSSAGYLLDTLSSLLRSTSIIHLWAHRAIFAATDSPTAERDLSGSACWRNKCQGLHFNKITATSVYLTCIIYACKQFSIAWSYHLKFALWLEQIYDFQFQRIIITAKVDFYLLEIIHKKTSDQDNDKTR
jgi:hypothetical protein